MAWRFGVTKLMGTPAPPYYPYNHIKTPLRYSKNDLNPLRIQLQHIAHTLPRLLLFKAILWQLCKEFG